MLTKISIKNYILIVLGFNDTSTLVGHFVISKKKGRKRKKRDSRGDDLFVLRFYGSVNPMGSCLAWSVYLNHTFTGQA